MDLKQFKGLPPAERLQLCQEYSQSPAVKLLKELCAEKQASLPDITDTDTKEAFLYKAIYQKATADAFYAFDKMAEHIQRGLNRA